MAWATITLELFKSGMHLTCEDTGCDEFIPFGNGNMLMEILNNIYDVVDPDATWGVTPKGEYVYKLVHEDGLSWDEALKKANEEFENEGLIKRTDKNDNN